MQNREIPQETEVIPFFHEASDIYADTERANVDKKLSFPPHFLKVFKIKPPKCLKSVENAPLEGKKTKKNPPNSMATRRLNYIKSGISLQGIAILTFGFLTIKTHLEEHYLRVKVYHMAYRTGGIQII